MNSFEKLRWILPPVLVLTVLLMAFDQALFADRAFASDTSLSEVPQSVMQTEQNLDDGNVNRGSIDKVEFLNVDGLDKQTIDNVMASAEFQAQVEELRKSGSPLPAMSVLVALFVMGSLSLGGAAGSGRSYVNVPLGRKLSDFFRVDKVPRVVTKTIDVVKKVPVYTTRVVKETLSRVVSIPRQVAYTAYKTVRKVSYKTREVVNNVMKYRPQSRMDKLSSMLRFIDRYTPETGHRVQRGIYSELRYLRREFEELRRMSGRRLRGRELYYYNRGLRQVQQAMGSIAAKIVDHKGHGSPEYHRLRSIYLKDVERRYVDRVVNYVKEPVVKFVEKAYTAFRTEYDVKTETYVKERTVTDVSYKDVIEQKEIKETVFDKKISPLNEKIGLALNYVRNLKRIKTKPSNRSFKNALKTVPRTSPLANLTKVFSNLGTDVNNTRKGYAVNSTEARVSVGNYNKFVRDMKAFALNVRKSSDPYTAMFGREYKQDVADRERMIEDYRARLDNLRMLKNELNAAWPAHGSGLHYARARSERFSKDIRQVNKSISRATKKLGDVRADYTRRFHDVLDQIDRLAYLKNTNTYVELLEKTNITFGIRHISPELAVNGSRPVFAGYSRKAQALFAATGGETEEDTTFATAELGVRPPKTDEPAATTTATQKQVAVPPKFKIAALTGDTNMYFAPVEEHRMYYAWAGFAKKGNVKIIGRVEGTQWLKVELPDRSTTWMLQNEKTLKVNGDLKYIPLVTAPKTSLAELRNNSTGPVTYGPMTSREYFESGQYKRDALSRIPGLGLGSAKLVSGKPGNWKQLTEAQQEQVESILTIPDVSAFPKNKQIVNYFSNNILPTLKYDGVRLIGPKHGTAPLQCKPWLDDVVIIGATGVNVPATLSNHYEWGQQNDVKEVAQIEGETTFKSMIQNHEVAPGDIIQIHYVTKDLDTPHTMALWKVDTDGIWVFDTNFGPKTESGQLDNTIRLRKMQFSTLNERAKFATIYRVQ